MRKLFKFCILLLALIISCNPSEGDGTGDQKSGDRISKITSTSDGSVFIIDFTYEAGKLSEISRPTKGTSRKIIYENDLATKVEFYENQRLEVITALNYENSILTSTRSRDEDGVLLPTFLEFVYVDSKLDSVNQYIESETGEKVLNISFDYDFNGSENVAMTTIDFPTSSIAYNSTYDDKNHHMTSLPIAIRTLLFYPEGISKNNKLSEKIVSDESNQSETTFELTYNEMGFPTTMKVITPNDESSTTVEYLYE